MKKISLSIAALALVLTVTFTSCKKDDTAVPVVSITGNGTIELALGATWTDPGATATDENDGTITPVVTGTVNTDKVGEYTITYTATDEAGNVGTATRTVKVNASGLAGTYAAVIHYADNTTDNYNPTVTVSSTVYNKIFVANFGNYQGSYTLTGTVAGNTITFDNFTSTGSPVIKITNATGTFTKTGSIYGISSIQYTEQVDANASSVITETWTKQ